MERLDENISEVLGHQMSNTLALQDFMSRAAASDQAAAQIILDLELFAARYQNGNYQLANETDLRPMLLERVLKAIFEPKSPEPTVCSYVGLEELRRDRVQQLRIFRAVHHAPLSFLLEQCCSYQGHVTQRLGFDRVSHLMLRALGTRRLEASLDPVLGRDFASIARKNIVAAWCQVCYALLAKDRGAISQFFTLARVMQDVLPLGRTDEPNAPWICLVAKGAGHIICGGGVGP